MKKSFILISMCLILAQNLFALQVDTTTAKIVAMHFLVNSTETPPKSLTYCTSLPSQNEPLIYVFEIITISNDNGGFILISADDAATPILGYSKNTRNFKKSEIPAQLDYLLTGYIEELRNIKSNNIIASQEIRELWLLSEKKHNQTEKSLLSVSPLLSTTWNQGQYYNALCPSGCPTGCAATAMAQIIKYWNHPAQGTGQHSYYHPNYGYLSANFANTNYNYSSMPNSLSSNNTAVATLMYHCGVSVEMQYAPAGSGAWVLTNDHAGYHAASCQNAFVTYFGYSQNIQGVQKANYSETAWINLLKAELNAGRPVQYAGWSSSGHTWVVDGYNNSNMLHCNWGWGGAYDGYFTVNALNPSSYQFNAYQQALINIMPVNSTPSCLNCPDFDFAIWPILSWQTHSSSHTQYGCKMYKVNVVNGSTYTFKTGCGNGGTANYDTKLELYNSNCNLLIDDDDNCESNRSMITWTANYHGDVYLKVKGFVSESGNYTLAFIKEDPVAYHYISTNPNPFNGGQTYGDGSYQSGQTCTITASPNNDYSFSNWTENGMFVSSNPQYSFVVNYNRHFEANFTYNPQMYFVNIIVHPAGSGNTSGSGMYYNGQICQLNAYPEPGYVFHSWSLYGSFVSSYPQHSHTVSNDITYTANFTSVAGIMNDTILDQCIIFPNPTSQLITIGIPNSFDNEPFNLDIYNSHGKIVKSYLLKENPQTFDVESLPEGLYFMHLSSKYRQFSGKFLKQ